MKFAYDLVEQELKVMRKEGKKRSEKATAMSSASGISMRAHGNRLPKLERPEHGMKRLPRPKPIPVTTSTDHNESL